MPVASLLPGRRHPGSLIPMRFCSLLHFVCLYIHLRDGLQFFFSVTMYMPQRALKSGFASKNMRNFALFSSAIFTIVVHSEFPPTLAGVHLARISMSLRSLCTCYTTESASGHLFAMA
jgi:hypothetical protein